MPGKFINEITGDTPAKDDLAVFFDKSKNSTAQATIAEMVNAGLDLAAGAKGQVPTIDVKVDAATSSLVNILTWGAGGGVDFKGTPTRPPTGTDEILTNDPANGLIGKTTLQQLVVAGGATILQPGTAVNTALVWNDTAGKWEPARAVSEAKNINGGATGELPFQLNTHVTAWIPLGNAGQVLTIGDIGTAGNSFIAPMWNDPVKELPTFTIADKGKPLAVKADGTGAEWASNLAISKIDSAGNGTGSNGFILDGISGQDHVAGTILVNLGQPATFAGYKGVFVVDQKNGTTDANLSAAVCAVVGNIEADNIVRHGFYVNGWNKHFGVGSGVGIVLGAPTYGPYSHERKNKSARIYCETDNSSTSNSRLIFEASAGNQSAYSPPAVIWSNGAFTVGVSNVGVYAPPVSAASILAKGSMQALEGFTPTSLADTAAANNRIYFSTTANKLVFKDSAGVVHPLYT